MSDPSDFVLLLPPSEGKASGGQGQWDPAAGPMPSLAMPRLSVAHALAHAEPTSLSLTGPRREAALADNAALPHSPVLPAHVRYRGVVLTALSAPTLTPVERSRASSRILFVSALAGLVAWDEPLPAYRAKVSARLDPIGRLDRFWAPFLPAALEQFAAGRPVIDLLPLEHAAALPPVPSLPWTRVELVGPAGQRSGHAGKSAKGQLARDLLASSDPMATLASWSSADGFTARTS